MKKLTLLILLFPSIIFSAELKIMSWNLQDMDIFDGNGTKRLPLQYKKELAIASTIKNVNPDVLLIQEAPNFIEISYFVKTNRLNYEFAHVRQQKNKRFADGMAVLIRKGLPFDEIRLETPKIPGSHRPEKARYMDWSYRGLLVTKVKRANIIGVHLKSPGGNKRKHKEAIIKRLSQAKGLFMYANSLAGTTIIAGDFNDAQGIGELERKYKQKDTMSVFKRVFKIAKGREYTQKQGFNIDHILVKDGTVSDRNVVITPWTISDHRAVWADVRY